MNPEEIILGTVQLGVPNYGINSRSESIDISEVNRILEAARACGIRMLDTATTYGLSHERIGKYHRDSSYSFQIISKWQNSPDEIQHSLETLGTDCLEGWMCHDLRKLNQDNWQKMMDYQREGLVNKIGVSAYSASEVEDLIKTGMVPDVIQVPLNLFNIQEVGKLKSLAQKGIEIHVRSIFLQGLFFKNPETLPVGFESIVNWLERLHDTIPSPKQRACAIIKYISEQKGVTKLVLGADDHTQLFDWFTPVDSSVSLPEIPMNVASFVKDPRLW